MDNKNKIINNKIKIVYNQSFGVFQSEAPSSNIPKRRI